MLGAICFFVASVSSVPPNGGAEPVQFSVWAVQGLKTGQTPKQFDAAAEPVRRAVEDLPYDVFRGIYSGGTAVAPKTASRLELNASYTLVITCQERKGNNAAHIDIAVELLSTQAGAPPRQALQTSMTVCTGRKVRLGGLKMAEGDLVIVLEMTG